MSCILFAPYLCMDNTDEHLDRLLVLIQTVGGVFCFLGYLEFSCSLVQVTKECKMQDTPSATKWGLIGPGDFTSSKLREEEDPTYVVAGFRADCFLVRTILTVLSQSWLSQTIARKVRKAYWWRLISPRMSRQRLVRFDPGCLPRSCASILGFHAETTGVTV